MTSTGQDNIFYYDFIFYNVLETDEKKQWLLNRIDASLDLFLYTTLMTELFNNDKFQKIGYRECYCK